ncbi:MAG TPA: hypothetical protein EYG74_04945 [Sulfurimonas autotrophica]|nr:hypothetical protein [Sulfurimonas autotrophica]
MKIEKKAVLLEQLKILTDFRKDKHKIEYPLHEIIFMSLFGLLKGFVTLASFIPPQKEMTLFSQKK